MLLALNLLSIKSTEGHPLWSPYVVGSTLLLLWAIGILEIVGGIMSIVAALRLK